MVGRTHNRWPYFFGNKQGNQMYWEGSKAYSTVLNPPNLSGLYVHLCAFIPFADQTPDCLPTFYKNGRKQLSLHQDKFGEDYFGRRELVILLFEGVCRSLIIKRGGFSRIIQCTPEVTVVLTPCANSLFWHGKLPSESRNSSTTFAFRRGIPSM